MRPALPPTRFAACCLLMSLFSAPINGQEPTAPTKEPAVTDSPLTNDQLAEAYEARSVRVSPKKNADPVDFSYRLLKPAGAKPGTKYPLVIFLHGAGERGSDNLAQLKYLPAWMAEESARAKYPCFVLAPQCRNDEKWVDIAWSEVKSTPQTPQPTADMLGAIAAVEETLTGEAVDPQRIYLTGLSMGGYGSWDLAARMPQRFAAMIPICGGADEATAGKIKDLPIWCFHGDTDQAVPVERSRTIIAAIRAAGGEPKYSELAGVGHDSWTPAYRDPAVLDWLFSQKKKDAKAKGR